MYLSAQTFVIASLVSTQAYSVTPRIPIGPLWGVPDGVGLCFEMELFVSHVGEAIYSTDSCITHPEDHPRSAVETSVSDIPYSIPTQVSTSFSESSPSRHTSFSKKGWQCSQSATKSTYHTGRARIINEWATTQWLGHYKTSSCSHLAKKWLGCTEKGSVRIGLTHSRQGNSHQVAEESDLWNIFRC